MARLKKDADYGKPATTKTVSEEMKAAALDAKLYRSPSGYYYWSGRDATVWPSIYSYRISDYSLGEVVAMALHNLSVYGRS